MCHRGVFSDQTREQTEDGDYVHAICLELEPHMIAISVAASPTPLASAETTPAMAKARILKGNCPLCGKDVYDDQERAKDNGQYLHGACLRLRSAFPPEVDASEGQVTSASGGISAQGPSSPEEDLLFL